MLTKVGEIVKIVVSQKHTFLLISAYTSRIFKIRYFITNLLMYFFHILQYYEMSYGLNVEMHKQVRHMNYFNI